MPHLLNKNHSAFLEDQIEDAQWQVVKHHQAVDYRTNVLVRKIYRQLTDPASLLLASGIGFILGELTKRRPSSSRGTADKAHSPPTETTSPLKVALNLLTSAQTLYTALPLAWLVKSRRHQPGTSTQAAKTEPHSVPASTSTLNRRKYNRRKPLS
ncbi:MAG TPA: hypothetical protein VIF10_18175 [Methylobacter sp.]|jgi:hypothetical protein